MKSAFDELLPGVAPSRDDGRCVQIAEVDVEGCRWHHVNAVGLSDATVETVVRALARAFGNETPYVILTSFGIRVASALSFPALRMREAACAVAAFAGAWGLDESGACRVTFRDGTVLVNIRYGGYAWLCEPSLFLAH
jgi:hypothetical protein